MIVKLSKILVLVIVHLNIIAYPLSLYASSTTYNNLEQSSKVYPTNPTEAHRLIDEGIKYYKNNESYTFPWLGHFYGAKAEYLSKEKKFKKSIIYQIKACEEHGKSRLFQDEVNQLENLLTCYAILSYSYSKDANYKELLNTTSTAIEIYESHENYYISENKNFYGYVTFLNLRNAAYDGLHDYGNAIKSNKKVITLLTKNGLKEKKAIELYIRTLKNLKNVYYDLGDSTNLDKYSVLHMDEAKKYYGDDNGKMIIIMEEEITMLLRGGYYKKAFEMNKKVRVIYADLLDNPGLDKKRKVEYTKALISALGTEDTMMKGFIDVNEMANIGLLNEILSLNNQLDMKDQNIEIYLDLIRFYNFQEDYRKIKVLFKKANILIDEQISYYEKHQKTLLVYFIDDKKRLLEVEAYYYLDTSEPKKALEIADNLKLLQSNSVGSSAVDSQVELKNLYGRIFKDLGKFKDSIKIYIEALDILNKSFEKNIDLEETVLNNLALSYAAIGNFKSASKYLKKLADNAEDVAIKEGVVTPRTDNKKMLAYNNYASSISKDNPGLSIKYLMKSYNINKNMNEMHRGIGFISTLNLISEHHISKKDFKTAEKYLKEGYSYAMRNISYTPRHLSNYIYLYSDMVAINNKDYDQCISLNEKFTQAYEAINNKSLALLPHYRMLKTCHQLKNDEELAFKYSYKIIKLIINEFDQNNLNLDFEISRTMKDNKYLVYLFIKDVLKHLNDDRSILDKYKGVDFFELMFKLQQIIKVNKLSVTLSQAISREMSEKKEVSLMIKNYSRLIKQRNSLIEIEISSLKKEYLKKRNNKLLKLDSKISKLKDNILKEYPDFQRNFVKQVVDISTLQETMGPDEAMIHLNLGALGMMLTTVTKEEIHLQTLTGTTNDRVKTEVTSIRNSIQLENNTPKIFDILSSSKLYDAIFNKATKEIIKNKKKLIIIPDGALYSIPFDLLFNRDTKKWLIESYAITVHPSANSYARLNNNIKFNKSKSFLGFGNPKIKDTYAANNLDTTNDIELNFSNIFTRGGAVDLKYLKLFPELPETEIELRSISSIFDNDSKIYVREDFNERQLKLINFEDYKVISFATHALVVGEIDSLSEPAIVLSLPDKISDEDDGLLTSSEILNLNLNNDLIILSACNTASSDGSSSSESLSGLANAFFYSGARSLLVTHWSIISSTSADLVIDTFNFLDDTDEDLSLALKKAKIKMIHNPTTSHPIYWAPYSLVGRSKLNF